MTWNGTLRSSIGTSYISAADQRVAIPKFNVPYSSLPLIFLDPACNPRRSHQCAFPQWLKWPGQAGAQGTKASRGVRNLAHFEHKKKFIFISITGSCYTAGGAHTNWSKGPCTVTLTTTLSTTGTKARFPLPEFTARVHGPR